MLSLNADLMLVLAVTSLLGSRTSDKKTLALLEAWRSIPDLFEQARLHPRAGDVYRERDRLEKEYRLSRLPFRTTENFRHRVHCSTKEHGFGAAVLRLVNGKGEAIAITRTELHEIEEHGGEFSPAVATFLSQLPPMGAWYGLTLVTFPGPLAVDQHVPGAYDQSPPDDPRWVIPKELRFKAPHEATIRGGARPTVMVEATLANPTPRPIVVVLWQVNPLNPLHAELVESESVKKAPPDPRAPQMPPPVPLPPMRVVVPPKTGVVFQAEVDLSEYVIAKDAPLTLQWTFHPWKAPPENGRLVVR